MNFPLFFALLLKINKVKILTYLKLNDFGLYIYIYIYEIDNLLSYTLCMESFPLSLILEHEIPSSLIEIINFFNAFNVLNVH